MKKVLALVLVLCMTLIMLPAFAVTAAQAPSLADEIASRAPLDGAYMDDSGVGTGCGFLDGNLHGSASVKDLLGVQNNDEMMEIVTPYVSRPDGTEVQNVRFNYTYQGYTHGGISWRGGVWFAILGAALEQGEDYTLTLLVGDDYYMEYTFTAQRTALATRSSQVKLYGTGGADVTVTFADANHGLVVGDTLIGCTHDECQPQNFRPGEFTVTEVNGATVKLHSDTYTTDHTLLEMEMPDGRMFALSIDQYITTTEATALVQFKEKNAVPGGDFDTRVVVEAYKPWLATTKGNADMALKVSFVDAAGKTRSKTLPVTSVYYSVTAGDDSYTASNDSVLFGVEVTGVPYGTKSVTAELVFTGAKEDSYSFGSANVADLDKYTTRPGYFWLQGETDITATSGKYEDPSFGETVYKLFDKTGAKYLLNREQKQGNTTDTVTWRYDRPVTVAMYEMFSGNDTVGGDQNRNPRGWRLYGSADGETGWTLIDEQKAPDGQNTVNIGEEGRGTAFTVAKPASYQYYKIEIDMTDSDYFQIGEILLYEKYDAGFDWKSVTLVGAPVEKTCDDVNLGDQGLDGLFDGQKNTKLGAYQDLDSFTVSWSYDAPVTAVAYGLMTGADSLRFSPRNPDGWTLYGSTDGDTWIPLDTAVYASNLSGEMLSYVINTPAAYQYYKIEFRIAHHSFQMDEIVLYQR